MATPKSEAIYCRLSSIREIIRRSRTRQFSQDAAYPSRVWLNESRRFALVDCLRVWSGENPVFLVPLQRDARFMVS